MDQLKYAILVAATVLATRKLNEIRTTPCPAPECAISDAFSVQRQIDSQEHGPPVCGGYVTLKLCQNRSFRSDLVN